MTATGRAVRVVAVAGRPTTTSKRINQTTGRTVGNPRSGVGSQKRHADIQAGELCSFAVRQEVAVYIEGGSDRGVAEPKLDGEEVPAGSDQIGDMGVP